MKRVIKVLYIMFFIIFFLGLTTSNADYTVTTETDYNTLINNLNNGLWIKSNVMNNNPWIFCRAHGEILPSSGARYTADGPMIQFPNGNNIPSQYYQNRFKIAYVVSRANTNQYTKREIQEAYWTILGQYTASGNAAKLVEIANAYQEYKLQGQQTNIVSENAKLTINSDGTAIYGPIKITFNFRQSNQVKFGGVSYQFCYENGTKIGTYNNNGVATPIIQICKLENGVYSSIDANNTGLIQNTEYSNRDLYVKINIEQLQANGTVIMKINQNDIDISANVYNIKGEYTKTGSVSVLCISCQNRLDTTREIDTNKSYKKGDIVKYNGFLWECSEVKVQTSQSTEQNWSYKKYYLGTTILDGNAEDLQWTKVWCDICGCYIDATSISSTKVEEHIKTEHGTLIGGGRYICKCHNTVFNEDEYIGHFSSKLELRYSRKTPTYSFTKVSCSNYVYIDSNNSVKCGTMYTYKEGEKYPAQKLTIFAGKEEKTNKEFIKDIEIPVIPSIKVELNKLSSKGETLNNAIFKIEAKQGTTNLIDLIGSDTTFNNVTAGVTKTINPQNFEPIYINITEIQAPNGYKTISKPINIKYTYSSTRRVWDSTCQPTENDWKATNWTWGGWTWEETDEDKKQENPTSYPNYYVTKRDNKIIDKIYVRQSHEDTVRKISIDVYNEAVIEKLTLLKVDANDVNTKLKGAIFSGTITNIKSFKYGGQQIVVENENNTYSFSYTLENGEIALEDVVLADEDANVEITLTEMKVPIPMDENNNIITDYYYKKLEGDITLTLIHNTFEGLTLVSFGYSGEEEVTVNGQNTGTVNTNLNSYEVAITIPNQRIIDISGKVWLDGQTGIKPARTEDGIMQNTERGVSGVIVELFEKVTDQQTNKETFVIAKQENNNDASTVTGNNGAYTFTGVPYGRKYTVKFTYDGINYEDTLYNVDLNGRKSDAHEDEKDRSTFNARFKTITYKQSNDGTVLDYSYNNGDSTTDSYSILNTKNNDGTAQEKFRMTAKTNSATYTATNTEIDLGLVKRGTDLALSTNVDSSKVIINGHTTNYTDYYENDDIKVVYNEETETLEIGSKSSFDIEDARYNFNLYSSDYNYRINDYVTSESWKGQLTTAEELKVYVTYKLKVENQSTKAATIDEITYKFDDKYNFSNKIYYKNNDTEVSITNYNISNNIIKIKDIELVAGTSQTIFLVFEIPLANLSETSSTTFLNSAEITSYSTAEGLIDKDSQPGNLWDEQGNPIHYEDDSDKANGINVNITDEQRQISGYVFDDTTYNGTYSDDEAKVNGVIVQLIELKTVNNNVYEYIWQETVSGSNVLKKLNAEGTAIETYEYCSEDDKVNGKYQFEGFIPGDYIVRFIYGDGSEYTYVANGGNKTLVTYNGEHNGQDYKSTIDNNYQTEWYNTATYNENASVARDNEARRLETMAYSVEIDAKKGLLLKLLDNVKAEDLNITEKETLISVYNELYDPDISVNDITDNTINKLLKEQTLKNTWMCAETSKIKIPVDSTDLTKTSDSTNVKATDTMQKVFDKVNFGLTKRPKTEIEVEKYITAFKLTATNGQVLVNAYMDVNAGVSTGNASSYFDKQDNLKGIKNSLKVIDTSWSYEIPTTEINTLVDGAKLEYEYTLVVKNSGEVDYLSKILTDEYMANTVEYKNNLVTKYAEEAKTKSDNYQIGKFLGTKYYTGVGEGEKVLTEVTHIRDYLHNDIEFIKGKGVDGTPIIAEKDASGNNLILKHRILDDRYAMQNIDVKTYLKTEAAGKMEPDGNAVLYSITLGKNPVDVSDGYLTFSNYIAEVMSYTNAAGRRAESSTPGNAEIIQDYPNTDVGDGIHEIDEASTSELKIVPTAGEDKQTNYIIITAVMLGLVVLTVGILVTKKHIKK